MSINKTRRILNQVSKYLGDFQAVKSGSSKKIGKRVTRRIYGKITGNLARKWFK